MEVTSVRSSTLGTFQDCQFKYYLQTVVGLESKPNKKALLGTIVHLVMELLAKARRVGHDKINDKYVDPKYLLDIAWTRHVKLYGNIHDLTAADKVFCAKQITNVLATRFNPLKLNIVAIEQQFELDIELPGFDYEYYCNVTKSRKQAKCKLRGTVDLVTSPNPDTIQVIDYKTGERKDWITGKKKELEDFQKDLQLLIYNQALRTLYPDKKNFLFTLFYTRDGGPFTVTFNEEERLAAIQRVRKLYNKIKAVEVPARIKDDESRKNEKFKCIHVCEFGKTRLVYQSLDKKYFVIEAFPKNLAEIEEDLIIDEKLYMLVDKYNICDRYRNILEKNPSDAPSIITNLSLNGKTVEVSKRNDYSHNRISRGKIYK